MRSMAPVVVAVDMVVVRAAEDRAVVMAAVAGVAAVPVVDAVAVPAVAGVVTVAAGAIAVAGAAAAGVARAGAGPFLIRTHIMDIPAITVIPVIMDIPTAIPMADGAGAGGEHPGPLIRSWRWWRKRQQTSTIAGFLSGASVCRFRHIVAAGMK
ncbi:hypothetical protein CFR71_01990 [Novacetimonas pomaceti]|uniref:Uncharacterized protein n=1 Tax=Novacetimonas pomaceti TaxID=2021998 RepID=A0A318QIF9_9PROT|nr:hypothetical protein CFR71_01990 [Novacetimonas pomaceti]